MAIKILKEFVLLVIAPLALAFLISFFMVPHPISISIENVLLLPDGKARLLEASEKKGVTRLFFSGEFWKRIAEGDFKNAFTVSPTAKFMIIDTDIATAVSVEGTELQQLLEQHTSVYFQAVEYGRGEVFADFLVIIFISAVSTRIGVYFFKRRKK